MENRKTILLTGLAVAVFFSFTVLFYGPLSQFLSNYEELWFTLGDVLKVILPVSLLAVGIAVLFFWLIPPKFSGFFLKLFFGVSLAFYIQGNYLRSSYGNGVMDGSAIKWSDYNTYGIFNTILWAVCIILPFAASFIYKHISDKPEKEKSKLVARTIIIASLFFTVIQIPALAVQTFSFEPKNSGSDLRVTTDGMYEMSGKQNVVMFVLDTLDEAYYQDFAKIRPDFEKEMTGFVHYDNLLASGARTTIGVPSMLTGKPYKRQTVYSEYLDEIYSQENPLSLMNDAGFDVRVYSENELFSANAVDYVSNFTTDERRVASWRIFLKKIYKLDLCKFLPHFLKKYVWFNTSEFGSAREESDYDVNDVRFARLYTEPDKETGESGLIINKKISKAFRLYHFFGAHEPFDMNRLARRKDSTSREEQVEGVMNIVWDVINDLKKKGLYDDATIIVTADHGCEGLWQHSMLLVKEAGSKGKIRTSHVPVSAYDITLLLADLTGKDLTGQEYGVPIDSLKEGMVRERHMFKNRTDDSRFIIEEYVTDSDASDTESMELVKTYRDKETGDTPYELGTKLTFDADATGNKYCQEGLVSTTGFRCTFGGPKILFSIPIKDPPKEGTLNAHFELQYKTVLGHKVIITANGEEVFSGVIDEELVDKDLDLKIPVSLLGSSNKLDIEFTFPDIDEKELKKKPRKRTETISLTWMQIDLDK